MLGGFTPVISAIFKTSIPINSALLASLVWAYFHLKSKSAINKYDIKKYGSGEEAQKYLYSCHNCGRNIQKNAEFCNDKCKDFILVYNNPCKWGDDCKMCKLSKRVRKEDDKE